MLGGLWVHTRTAMLNAQLEASKRTSAVARIEDQDPMRSPAGATPLSTEDSVVWHWKGTGEPTKKTSPPRANVQRSSALTLAMSKSHKASEVAPPILPSGATAAAPATAGALLVGPAFSRCRDQANEPSTQPSTVTPFATVRQGQAQWLTQQSDRLSPERKADELTSAEVSAAQADAASSAGLSDPRTLAVTTGSPGTSSAAGLELEALDRQPLSMNTEELRVEENLMRARSYDASMYRV